MKKIIFPSYMPDTLKIKEIADRINELLEELNEKGIIELEEQEVISNEENEA